MLIEEQPEETQDKNNRIEHWCQAIGSVRTEPIGADRVKKYASYTLDPNSPLRGTPLNELRRISGVVFNYSGFIEEYRKQGTGKTVKIELKILLNGRPFLKWEKTTALDAQQGLISENGALIKISNEIAKVLDDYDHKRAGKSVPNP